MEVHMPFWRISGVSDQPMLTMCRWVVFECTNNRRYLVGWCPENREGRCSTAIVAFDPAKLVVRTESGRLYRLDGPPQLDPDAFYVWEHFYSLREDLVLLRDASHEYTAGDQRIQGNTAKSAAAKNQGTQTKSGSGRKRRKS
jgi:hypothetical protein